MIFDIYMYIHALKINEFNLINEWIYLVYRVFMNQLFSIDVIVVYNFFFFFFMKNMNHDDCRNWNKCADWNFK